MKNSERPSKQAHARDSLHQHLHLYALAASAAGVSMLALAQSSEAEIIYTPARQSIGFYNLDLTGDGTTDFTLWTYRNSSFGSVRAGDAHVSPAQTGNGVQGYIGFDHLPFASALKAGYSIGPSGKFVSASLFMARASANLNRSDRWKHCYGQFQYPHDHYLGLKFMISGEVHYGWARLNVKCFDGVVAGLLTGYAYETVPNQSLKAGQKREKKEELGDESLNGPDEPTPPSIQAPASATLGILAKGAPALSIWRRE